MAIIIIILFVITGLQLILPKFSVHRPVTTSMIFTGIILIGSISLIKLPQELYPPITYPQLTVATTYANAAPEEIETLITKTIEEAISTVKNLKAIHSVSKEGISLVIADFAWGTDMNIASLHMREKIDMVKEALPRDAQEPVVLKYNPYALPIMILSVTGNRPSEYLRQISKKIIKDKLEKLEGVANASITGGREREIRVDINQAELKSSNIGLIKVVDALKNSNLNYPAGTTKEKFYEYLIRTMGEFKTVKEIGNTPITLYDVDEQKRKKQQEKQNQVKRERRIIYKKRLIFLKDIAKIKDTFKEPSNYSRYNGRPNISIAIQKQASANTIKTVQLVKEELKHLKGTSLPKSVNVKVVYDQSMFIRGSIHNVINAAWQGGLLVFLVLFVFLRRFSSAFIVTVSIPISIFATFSLMFFQGVSINMISLGGLALGIGMMVDNSIVVVENIYRHQQLGEGKKDSAISGTNEVAGAISASTLTSVAVFLPLVFLFGVIGQILKAFSFTIAFSLTASLFAGLTLVPLLSSKGKKILKTIKKKRFDFIRPLIYLDEHVLSVFMRHKAVGLGIAFIAFIMALGLFNTLDREVMPKVDTGQFTLKVNLPTGTKLDITNSISKKIESYLLKQNIVSSVTAIVGSARKTATGAAYQRLGSHQAQIVVRLKRRRKIHTRDFIQKIENDIDKFKPEYAKVDYIMEQSTFTAGGGGGMNAPIVLKIHGKNLDELNSVAAEAANRIKHINGLYDVKTTLASPSPETKIIVNKDRAAVYDINVRDIAQTALIAIKGLTATKFKEGGNEYDIRVRLDKKYRKNMGSLKNIQIYSAQGFSVPLDELVTIKSGKGPSEIKRYDQERVIFVSANLFGKSLKTISKEVSDTIKGIKCPEGYGIALIGETEEAKASIKNLIFILLLAFTLVYMIMASQFESLWQPFIIMFSVPFAIVGVALILFFTRSSINGMVMIGVLLLGGIVVNNAIVLIEYLNQILAEGKDLIPAAIEASKIRLRPILMTALTTVLGFTPMAISHAEGSELLSPLAITVMGGLVLSTLLTLWVIPVIYVITAKWLGKA